MAQIEVKIMVEAANVLEAETQRQGIQAVVNELNGYEGFIAELGQPGIAKQYRQRLDTIMKNPLFRTLASKL